MPMNVAFELDQSVLGLLWPLLRISGAIMLAPVFGSVYVPVRIRALLAIVLTVAASSLAAETPDVGVFEAEFLVIVFRELAIGLSIGFVLRMVIDAAIIGGQVLATSMGLHFATVVDPNQGGTPTVGQFYVIVATLLLLVSNAHLALVELLVDSFVVLPIADSVFTTAQAWSTILFAGRMFVGGLQLALPSVAAILMVNVAFGVVSRAAPTLNLFAVGFPVAMFVGFLIMLVSINDLYPIWTQTVTEAFSVMTAIASGG